MAVSLIRYINTALRHAKAVPTPDTISETVQPVFLKQGIFDVGVVQTWN